MPYYSYDSPAIPNDSEEADLEPANDGDEEYTYEFQRGEFSLEQLGPTQQDIHRALAERGVEAVRCSYEGGQGGAIARFDKGIIGDRTVGVTELAEAFAAGPFGDVPTVPSIRPTRYLEKLSRRERAKEALDFYAYTLALLLLGSDYGAGGFTMYGTFLANLQNGELVDQR